MTFFKKTLMAAALAASTTLATAPMVAYAQETNIVEAAVATESLSTLVTAVQAAGLAETLSGEGPFTVFAPTNDAFAKLPDGTVATLVEPENKEQLTGILTYHVVPGKVMAADVVKLINDGGGEAKVTTVNGAELTLRMEGESVAIVDAAGSAALVTAADMEQSNGVVHVIDTVLMPTM